MAYSTLTDIEETIPTAVVIQLTDDANSGAVDAAKVTDCIAKGDGIIDSYCAVKYSVPFTTVPSVIKTLSCDIAIKYLYARRVEEMPNTRQDAYDAAISFLKDVSRGTATLGVDPAPAPSPQGSPEVSTPNRRIFTRDKLSDL